MTKYGYVAGVVAVVVVALVVVGAALTTGFGPAPGGNSETIEEFPTQTPGPSHSSASSGGDSDSARSGGGLADANDTTATGSPFAFDVDDISDCGETCRDVTATLTNEQSTAASDVVVYTRIFVGNGTDGPVVWQGSQSLGTLDANESVTVTTTMALTVPDGLKVRNNGGHITAQTSVDSEGGIVTVTKQRDVT